MKTRTIIMAASMVFSAVLLSGCQNEPAAERQMAVDYEIKDGYYMSDTDDSYVYIDNGYVELVGYDISADLRKSYDEGVEQGLINPDEDSFEEFSEASIEFAEENADPKPYIIKTFPDMETAILATEWEETGKGGGSWSGYIIIDNSTLSANGAKYVYAGEEIQEAN